jgi:hypothetical protein
MPRRRVDIEELDIDGKLVVAQRRPGIEDARLLG